MDPGQCTRVCGDSARIDDSSGEIDHGFEAFVCFASSHGDALELLEFAEEVLDEVPPFLDVGVDVELLLSPGMLGDDDFGTALIEFLP
ncbi:hypothetical protein [Niveispirillum irakense]|uniref:hypothetical protein n=1 Tax=Niveispirillum irakense TaxID=34011 RepID=UPI00048DE88D